MEQANENGSLNQSVNEKDSLNQSVNENGSLNQLGKNSPLVHKASLVIMLPY